MDARPIEHYLAPRLWLVLGNIQQPRAAYDLSQRSIGVVHECGFPHAAIVDAYIAQDFKQRCDLCLKGHLLLTKLPTTAP